MRIGRVVDLSLPLDETTQVYPGDPPVRLRPAATIADTGFNLLALELGSQSGTNVDAPLHFRDGGAPIDEMPLTLCLGPAAILDVRHKRAREAVTRDDVEAAAVPSGAIVVFHTGWSLHYGTPRYLDHPYVCAALVEELLEQGVRTFCLDAMNIDETPDDDHPGVGFPVHHLIADAGGLIVENLHGLELVDFPSPMLSVLPLRLTGADGAPTRAVAFELLA
jgi:kynurenine formamidase